MRVLNYWSIKTKKENVSGLCLCVDTVYWQYSIHLLLKYTNPSYIFEFLHVVNEISVRMQRKKFPLLDNTDVEREQVSTCIQEMSWPNLFYIFKTRKQKQNLVFIKLLSILIDDKSRVLRMRRAQQTRFLFKGINTTWRKTSLTMKSWSINS